MNGLLMATVAIFIATGVLVGDAQARSGYSAPRKGKAPEATKVLSVDCSANTITTKHGNDTTTYMVDSFTVITINGQKGDLTGVKPGMDVTVSAAGGGGKKATRIDATGSGGEPAKSDSKKKK